MAKVFSVLLCVLFFSTSATAGESGAAQESVPLAPSLEKIADGVWIHKSHHDIEPWGPVLSQGMVIQTSAGVTLVDTAWTNEDTKRLLALIEEETGEAPDVAIVTHAHHDKMGGMDALIAAGVHTAAFVLTNEDAPSRGIIPAEEPLFKSFGGNPRAIRTDSAAHDDTHNGLFWLHPGPGHTRDNIVVYYEPAKVLFGGCLIRPGDSNSLGNTADGDVANWAVAVRNVAEAFPDAEIVIPSHGPMGGRGLLDHTIALAEAANE